MCTLWNFWVGIMDKHEIERMRRALELRVANHPYMDCDSKTRIILRLLDLCEEEIGDD